MSAVQTIIVPRMVFIYIVRLLSILFLLISLQEESERGVNHHNKHEQHKRDGKQGCLSVSCRDLNKPFRLQQPW